ncbi:HK97 family phage prohead protease [Clostridium novyi]
MNKENEIRSFNNFEVRQIGEGEEKQTHIQGYALTFDTISEDLGFKETIRKGALDHCDMDDVVLNFNHNSNMILARNCKNEGVGSLKLSIDDKGLFFDAIPTNTSYARDLITNMENKIIGKCSFAFNLDWTDKDAQTWDWDDGKRGYDFRTINKIAKISDCSIVVNPAYESTSSTVYKRSKENYLNEKKKLEQRKLDKEKMLLELELLK